MPKLKEILASKLKKIAKTQVFGKSTCVHAPPDCEKKSLVYAHKCAIWPIFKVGQLSTYLVRIYAPNFG